MEYSAVESLAVLRRASESARRENEALQRETAALAEAMRRLPDRGTPALLRVAEIADKAAASTDRAASGLRASVARMRSVGAKLTKTLRLDD